jgi:hypothetical protein
MVTISIEAFGAGPDQSADSNLASFRRAIAAVPAGGTLLIPAFGDRVINVSTPGGIAIMLDKPVSVRIDGHLRQTDGQTRPSPPYLFGVSASNVSILGKGKLAGPGEADDSNASDDRTFAGLIFVTGDDFLLYGPTIVDPPKVGIHLWNCRRATISATWRGGIVDYVKGHTGLFGIRATGGGGHQIVGNQFMRGPNGGRLITAYFAGGLLGGTTADIVSHNSADVHEKLAYMYTNRSEILSSYIVNAKETDAVRIIGSNNRISKLYGDNLTGGISIYNGYNNIVENCKLTNIFQSGIFVSDLEIGPAVTGSGTKIIGNTVTSHPEAHQAQDGICCYFSRAGAQRVLIDGNRVEGCSSAPWAHGIRVQAVRPFYVETSTISGNVVRNATISGVSFERSKASKILRNDVRGIRSGNKELFID